MKSANQLGLSEKVRYAERDAELRQMRIIATALLLCMAALFVFGKYMETRYDGYWGFLRIPSHPFWQFLGYAPRSNKDLAATQI